MSFAWFPTRLTESHVAIFGETGTGKSGLLQLIADELAADPQRGFTLACPHGTAREVADRLANPARAGGRAVHLLDPASDLTFGINPFETEDQSWSAAHAASLMWTSSVASLYATAMHETPRLERVFYVLSMFAAYHGLTLVELLHALSLCGERVREFMLTAFDNAPISNELEDLHRLAAKSPARFLELTESCRNRLVRWLGDKRLARIFGRSKGNLDARAVMDGREIVLVDLSSLPAEDAAFLGTLLTCRYFIAAKRRPPNVSAAHHLIIDEAASMLCTATAEMLDQTRKFGLHGIFALQRIGQLKEKGEFITEALMVNAGVKLVFRIPEPISARYLAEQLFTGFIDLAEWKAGTERPTAVRNDKVVLKSRSRAIHHAEQSGRATTDMHSHGRASAATRASMSAWGSGFADAASASFSGTPTAMPFAGPIPVSQQLGRSEQRSGSASGGRSAARSVAHHTQHGRATTTTHATADGTSHACGEAEAYVTRYEDLPSSLYSLEEQLHRLSGEIMNLPNRELFLKLPGEAPIRVRTPNLSPAFNSIAFQRLMLPRFQSAVRESPYLVPAATVDAEIDARLARILSSPGAPEPDFAAPEPLPIVDPIIHQPQEFAAAFWRRRNTEPAASPPEPPAQTSDGKEPPLRLIKGGKDEGDNTDER